MELFLDDALTVGELKRVLAGIPDDAVVGTSMLGLVGHVEAGTSVFYCKEHNIIAIDHDKHAGSFSDEEFEKKDFVELE